MAMSTYTVIGMPCGHCEQADTRELTNIGGVTGVDVTLAGGTVTVTSDDPIDEAAVQDAVEEAGYEMVG